MARLTTKLFVVALTASSLAMAASAQAGGCSSGGGGFGGYGGYRGSPFPSYRRAPAVYTTPRTQFQPQQQQIQPQQPQQFQAQQPQQPQAPAQNGLSALGGTQQAPAANTQQSAEMTALQALAGMGGSQTQTQPAATQPQTAQPQATQPQQPAQVSTGRVGTWVAKVGTEATVKLDLRADGSFTWTATRNGKSSNFQGQYSLQGNQMTLTRGDSQKLAGVITSAGGGFNFKLEGAKDNGLIFARG